MQNLARGLHPELETPLSFFLVHAAHRPAAKRCSASCETFRRRNQNEN